MTQNIKFTLLLLLPGLLLLSSCDKKGKEAEKTPYWGIAFHPGNFAINDQSISIYIDAGSTNRTADYVQREDLPDSSFHSYSIRFYLATSTDSFKIVADSAAANILVNSVATTLATLPVTESVSVIDSGQYAIFGVTGLDSLNLGNKDDFQNISFVLYVHYIDLATGSKAADRHLTADLYKKE